MTEFSEEVRAKTYEEIEQDEVLGDPEEITEEFEGMREGFRDLCELMFTAIMVAEMFRNGFNDMTFGEYLDMIDYLAESGEDLDVTIRGVSA